MTKEKKLKMKKIKRNKRRPRVCGGSWTLKREGIEIINKEEESVFIHTSQFRKRYKERKIIV